MKIDQRFYKLMALTDSPNDNEALIAIREANKMLRANKLTWEELLNAAKDTGFEALRVKYNWLVEQYNLLAHTKNKPRGTWSLFD